MFLRPLFHFFTHKPSINFMKGRWAGLATSAVLSTLSIALFFWPGLRLGLDFRGGIVMEIHTPAPVQPESLVSLLEKGGVSSSTVQTFGRPDNLRVSLNLSGNPKPGETDHLLDRVRKLLTEKVPGVQILSASSVGASVSRELLQDGILALALSLAMIVAYIWFRFEREFAWAAVITLILDLTKTIGFIIAARFEFDLVMVAALLTILGYSTNDKVVVYDRVRENLRRYRSMELAEILNLSINETLSRTLATSSTLFLAALPLALFGGSSLTGFAWVMLFGIVVGTSSSIFIAAPLLLLMGQKRLRPAIAR